MRDGSRQVCQLLLGDLGCPREEICCGFALRSILMKLRLRREDYQGADIARWAETLRVEKDRWSDAFVYFKHEESGIGPKLAAQFRALLGETFA